MTQHNAQCEFLSEAAQESLRIVETKGARACDDFSLCMPTSDADQTSYRRFGQAVLLRFILGMLGFVGGALIVFLDLRANDFAGISVWLLLAACCSVGGILIMLSNTFFQRRFVRRQTSSRWQELASLFSIHSPVCVAIENAATFNKFKLLPEDLDYLALDPARGMLVIEGIRYRYLIHGKDVRKLDQVAGGTNTATAIEYTIGNTTLDIAIQHDSPWHELKRQTVGAKHDVLIARISETLGINERSQKD